MYYVGKTPVTLRIVSPTVERRQNDYCSFTSCSLESQTVSEIRSCEGKLKHNCCCKTTLPTLYNTRICYLKRMLLINALSSCNCQKLFIPSEVQSREMAHIAENNLSSSTNEKKTSTEMDSKL